MHSFAFLARFYLEELPKQFLRQYDFVLRYPVPQTFLIEYFFFKF